MGLQSSTVLKPQWNRKTQAQVLLVFLGEDSEGYFRVVESRLMEGTDFSNVNTECHCGMGSLLNTSKQSSTKQASAFCRPKKIHVPGGQMVRANG